jgi:uncharacterized protein (DUF1697 family)
MGRIKDQATMTVRLAPEEEAALDQLAERLAAVPDASRFPKLNDRTQQAGGKHRRCQRRADLSNVRRATVCPVATFVALLRGINVGKAKQVAMADLQALLADLGYADVRTHLRSGNAIFSADTCDPEAIAIEIEAAIRDRFGLEVAVLIRTPADLDAVIAGNPFPEAAATAPAKLHVAFLSAAPAGTIDAAAYAPEKLRIAGREVYAWYPNGMGRSKLTNTVLERHLGVSATMRNWNTVTKLAELAAG